MLCWLAIGRAAAAENVSPAMPVEEKDAYLKVVRPYLQKHCFRCHGPDDAKAGLTLHNLGIDFLKGKNADVWKEVVDRIQVGDMPPKREARPDPKDSVAVTDWIHRQHRWAEREARRAGGAVVRRLNRTEYIHTVCDLFQLDPNLGPKIEALLPADGKYEGFDRVGAALFLDRTQLESYLAAAAMLSEEIVAEEEPPRASRQRFELEQGLLRRDKGNDPKGYELRDDGIEFLRCPGNAIKGNPWGRIGNYRLDDLVTEDGYYRIRIRAGVSSGNRDEPNRFRIDYAAGTPVAVEKILDAKGKLDSPEVTEVTLFLRPGGADQARRLSVFWNDTRDAIIGDPEYGKLSGQQLRLRGRLGQAIAAKAPAAEIAALRKELDVVEAQVAAWKKPTQIYNPAHDIKRLPRALVDYIEIEGPLPKEWPPASHKQLFFAGTKRQDEAYIREVFARLLPRAYRRPVSPDEVNRIVNVVVTAQHKQKLSFREAMRLGVQTVLCSPGFLFMPTPGPEANQHTDHALAARLSYFLWSSMPDEVLFDLAAKGKLSEPAILEQQVTRMLRDPKSQRFVHSFAGQWLDVSQFGTVQPAREYRDYDKALEQASKEEALAFFGHVLQHNESVLNFLDSDFLVINERLARHYGISGVNGPEFRKVALLPEHHRGGILGMAGVLTMLADGTRTLPVRRGAWIQDKLFNSPPPPPPPNAGEIQPNTTGMRLTVRQRLDKHRNDATCASCHTRIDPLGLALENYDAIGAWRTKQNGEGFRAPKAP
ncbi:MAG: DUF1592 domain-containing protein, partial [Gemmataceae bacterium]